MIIYHHSSTISPRFIGRFLTLSSSTHHHPLTHYSPFTTRLSTILHRTNPNHPSPNHPFIFPFSLLHHPPIQHHHPHTIITIYPLSTHHPPTSYSPSTHHSQPPPSTLHSPTSAPLTASLEVSVEVMKRTCCSTNTTAKCLCTEQEVLLAL